MGAEGWVLRGGNLRTPPGPEGSNGKEVFLGAAGCLALSTHRALSSNLLGRWGFPSPLFDKRPRLAFSHQLESMRAKHLTAYKP